MRMHIFLMKFGIYSFKRVYNPDRIATKITSMIHIYFHALQLIIKVQIIENLQIFGWCPTLKWVKV